MLICVSLPAELPLHPGFCRGFLLSLMAELSARGHLSFQGRIR